jgi:transcriptional regulator of acetoin/glycerol metabolism
MLSGVKLQPISNAAKMLGISRPMLYDLMKQYGIEP